MTPHAAPTTRFSPSWHHSAAVRPPTCVPATAAAAKRLATSTAAEEETPLPSGTADDSSSRSPVAAKCAFPLSTHSACTAPSG